MRSYTCGSYGDLLLKSSQDEASRSTIMHMCVVLLANCSELQRKFTGMIRDDCVWSKIMIKGKERKVSTRVVNSNQQRFPLT